MISCTEFIPSYSELFSYIDENFGGHKAVEDFWAYLFKPDGKGIPLINYAKEKGLRGCWEYWNSTLTEEAADNTRWFNEKAGWIHSTMHYCPSKGRLLKLEEELGIKPYYDYCGHCDYYRAALNEVGLDWLRIHINVDKASCQSLIFDPTVFKGMVTLDDSCEKMEIHSSDREYFHPDFHSSLNMGIDYLGKNFGTTHLKKYLTRYTLNVYRKIIEKANEGDALKVIADKIIDTYNLEKTPEVLHLTNDGSTLFVKIDYCPAVKHLRSTGRTVSPFFRYATEYVMETLAENTGLSFIMDSYDEETGAAAYRFIKK